MHSKIKKTLKSNLEFSKPPAPERITHDFWDISPRGNNSKGFSFPAQAVQGSHSSKKITTTETGIGKVGIFKRLNLLTIRVVMQINFTALWTDSITVKWGRKGKQGLKSTSLWRWKNTNLKFSFELSQLSSRRYRESRKRQFNHQDTRS